MISRLESLFERATGSRPLSVVDLRADGSSRLLFRLQGSDGSAIGVFGPDDAENAAFVSYSRALRSIGLPVPEIYAEELEAGLYLEEDLGDETLFGLLQRTRSGDDPGVEALAVYERAVDLLPRFQIEGGRVVDYSLATPTDEFDRRSMLWDLNYFKYHFLKLAHIPFDERGLERDFDHLCDHLLEADRGHFLYRDFQSRNIMVRDGSPWMIDYQGGRRGALQYDLASLLYDAKADLPERVRRHLVDRYLAALTPYNVVDGATFLHYFDGYVLVRILQAMGAYGYRGFFERKPHFLASVPFAVGNLTALLERGLPIELPELARVIRRIGERSWGSPSSESSDTHVATPVKVTIRSFSYRRGYPEDDGGHGGGFVFDCRSIPNPGRDEECRDLCGRDREVVDYLERSSDVNGFFEGVLALVLPAVDNYRRRGFDSLAVSFGCTGGQHRSVYFAERLARHLRERTEGVDVRLHHREEDRWPARTGPEATLLRS